MIGILHRDGLKSFFCQDRLIVRLVYVSSTYDGICVEYSKALVAFGRANEIWVHTKKIVTAVFYSGPTGSRSVSIPAILALPKNHDKQYGRIRAVVVLAETGAVSEGTI